MKINIPNVSSLVMKTDYDTKITEIKKKITDHTHDYVSTPEFNKLKLAQADLVTKTENVKSLIGKLFQIKRRT